MSYNPYSLEGKTILVTGASSGIGKATAIECSKLGARVVITGRDETRLCDTYSLLQGENHIQSVADLGKDGDVSRLINELPVLDGIAHIAGIVKTIPVTFLKKEDMQQLFDVNFFAPTLLTTCLLRQKKVRKLSSIVFISSIEGPITVHPGNSVYSASKSAVIGMMKGLSVELASKKIRVNAVLPGMTDTPINYGSEFTEEQLLSTKNQYPLKRAASPEEIAWAIIYFLSDASGFTTGASLVVDGGFTVL